MSLGDQLSGLKEHIADGFRGKPDIDVGSYAEPRGLEDGGQMAQAGVRSSTKKGNPCPTTPT